MTHKPDAVEIRDNRQLMKERSREVCRVCGSPDVHVGHYGQPTIKCISYLRDERNRATAELKQLRNIIAFYGIEIMPDGSFTSPRITQNEVDLKELREFVGAMETGGTRVQLKGGCEIVPRFDRWFVYDGAGSIFSDYITFREAFDAWRNMNAGEGE